MYIMYNVHCIYFALNSIPFPSTLLCSMEYVITAEYKVSAYTHIHIHTQTHTPTCTSKITLVSLHESPYECIVYTDMV